MVLNVGMIVTVAKAVIQTTPEAKADRREEGGSGERGKKVSMVSLRTRCRNVAGNNIIHYYDCLFFTS